MIDDPRFIRLSKHFLLSDLVGCNSVYTEGYANVWDGDEKKLREGRALCEELLEPLLEEYGPCSVSYGYVSPALSQKIVKYMDPTKPSYHRWDDGAAADVCFHDWVAQPHPDSAPVFLAHEIDAGYDYSRMITYSESPFICLATKTCELKTHNPRKAFYENRYHGSPKEKPEYITKSKDFKQRVRDGANIHLKHDWRGAGYPTHHGGGRKQAHHHRVSKYSVLSDWLYDGGYVNRGQRNMPILSRTLAPFSRVGGLYDELLGVLGVKRISIPQGWAAGRADGYNFAWKNGVFSVVLCPPDGTHETTFKNAVMSIDGFTGVNKVRQGYFSVSGTL